ncbi:unnamed protein product, partial [Heterotrigona itama]
AEAYDAYAGGISLCGFLEKFKESIKNGNQKLGIPVLDPLRVNHLDLNVNKEELLLQGYLNNIHAIGLSNYVVNRGDFSIVGLIANVSLLFNQIDLMTEYNVKGTLMNKISLYGHGNIALDIRKLNVSVNLQLSTVDQKIQAKNVVLNVHVKEFNLKITGLFDDEDLSATLSKAISDILPGIIDDYQSEISKKASSIVENLLNQFLKKFTLKDLLDIIKG